MKCDRFIFTYKETYTLLRLTRFTLTNKHLSFGLQGLNLGPQPCLLQVTARMMRNSMKMPAPQWDNFYTKHFFLFTTLNEFACFTVTNKDNIKWEGYQNKIFTMILWLFISPTVVWRQNWSCTVGRYRVNLRRKHL